MFVCLFNSARAGEVIQLSPVAAHLHFLSTEGVVVVQFIISLRIAEYIEWVTVFVNYIMVC
jgi:hypothetical protein